MRYLFIYKWKALLVKPSSDLKRFQRVRVRDQGQGLNQHQGLKCRGYDYGQGLTIDFMSGFLPPSRLKSELGFAKSAFPFKLMLIFLLLKYYMISTLYHNIVMYYQQYQLIERQRKENKDIQLSNKFQQLEKYFKAWLLLKNNILLKRSFKLFNTFSRDYLLFSIAAALTPRGQGAGSKQFSHIASFDGYQIKQQSQHPVLRDHLQRLKKTTEIT